MSEDEAHCTYIKVKGLVAMVNNLRQDASPLLGNHFLQLVYSKILDRNQNRIYVNPGLHKSIGQLSSFGLFFYASVQWILVMIFFKKW